MASDAELLAAIAKGNEPAFGELVARYQARFYGVARRMLRSDADAEDAVQLAFLRVHHHAGSYSSEWSGSTWLYRILTNVAIDLGRKNKRRAETLDVSAATVGERTSEHIDLDRALAKLPSEARAALVLCYVQDLSYSEIARVRGVSVNTVKTHLLRAKRLMRKLMNEVKT